LKGVHSGLCYSIIGRIDREDADRSDTFSILPIMVDQGVLVGRKL
jgi:hypothetical protein